MEESGTEPDSPQDEDLERVLASIERLYSTIGTFSDYVQDLKAYLQDYVADNPSIVEFSSVSEYNYYQQLPPISDDEVREMNVDLLVKELSESGKKGKRII